MIIRLATLARHADLVALLLALLLMLALVSQSMDQGTGPGAPGLPLTVVGIRSA